MKKENPTQFYIGFIISIIDAILVFAGVISDGTMVVILIIAITLIGTSNYRLLK